MAFDSYDDKAQESDEGLNKIDPRDTYGSRFSVSSRRVAKTSDTPRSAITSGTRHIRNSNKIFTKKHEKDNLGGTVNIENINRAKAKILVTKDEEVKKDKPQKSSGLDSLFEPTSNNNSGNVSNESQENQRNVGDTKDEKYQAKGKNRPLKIIRPISFNSAKEISTALKAGSAVVICLKGINEENAKRLLDFSFGAAAMCGARVSLEAEKTYVITIGPGLSQREKLLCVKEGIALKVDGK